MIIPIMDVIGERETLNMENIGMDQIKRFCLDFRHLHCTGWVNKTGLFLVEKCFACIQYRQFIYHDVFVSYFLLLFLY